MEYTLKCNHITRDIKDFGKCPNCDLHTLLRFHEISTKRIEDLKLENKKLKSALKRLATEAGDGSGDGRKETIYNNLESLQIEYEERIEYAKSVLEEIK